MVKKEKTTKNLQKRKLQNINPFNVIIDRALNTGKEEGVITRKDLLMQMNRECL